MIRLIMTLIFHWTSSRARLGMTNGEGKLPKTGRDLTLMAILVTALMFLQTVEAIEMPSSIRSRAAVQRVEPGLKAALSRQGMQLGSPVFLRIFKENRELEIWVRKGRVFERFRTYRICTYSGRLGPKLKEGDRQAPEGCYFVTPGRMNPNSRYHLSFNLGYPNRYDRLHKRTGSALMVHGACASVGCYAMGDKAIEEIWTLCYRALENGQKYFRVHCFPFPLTRKNLVRHKGHASLVFWNQLKPIYEHFERTRVPPNVIVVNRQYTIDPATPVR